jgi:hypothetical protein
VAPTRSWFPGGRGLEILWSLTQGVLPEACVNKEFKTIKFRRPNCNCNPLRVDQVTVNKGRNLTLRGVLCKPTLTSGLTNFYGVIYKRRCLILCATKRAEWLMSCVQQTGAQSQPVFITCCHLLGNCSTAHHIVATDVYLKEQKQFVSQISTCIFVDKPVIDICFHIKVKLLYKNSHKFQHTRDHRTVTTIAVKLVQVITAWRYIVLYEKFLNLYSKSKLHGLGPRVNYTDRATAVCRRSDCQLLRIEGATWSVWRIPSVVFSIF